ncbi:hypothetical protein BRADI_2g33985v3 [Brachypodium distachyon]|uniref:Uncharacterized protein n=1 Tax=Brachypodium distachyon TaxID=15368 RepID=A0A0Q3G778_BRADI|nr:hypothetical protein BRADI_2g33985v3 [Brachypodium distachyon]
MRRSERGVLEEESRVGWGGARGRPNHVVELGRSRPLSDEGRVQLRLGRFLLLKPWFTWRGTSSAAAARAPPRILFERERDGCRG